MFYVVEQDGLVEVIQLEDGEAVPQGAKGPYDTSQEAGAASEAVAEEASTSEGSDPLGAALAEGEKDFAEHNAANPPKHSGPVILLAQAEQNGALSTGRMNFSFGNGNEHSGTDNGGWGLVLPFDAEVTAVTLGSRVAADKNGAAIRLVHSAEAGSPKAYEKTELVVKLGDGERIARAEGAVKIPAMRAVNFVTENPGGNDFVVAVWGRWL